MQMNDSISGFAPLPLVVVEIFPLNLDKYDDHAGFPLSAELVKIQLKKVSLSSKRLEINVHFPHPEQESSSETNFIPGNQRRYKRNVLMKNSDSSLYSGILHVKSSYSSKRISDQENQNMRFFSDDPTIFEPILCHVKGHVLIEKHSEFSHKITSRKLIHSMMIPVIITEGTLVRIRPISKDNPLSPNMLSKCTAWSFIDHSIFHNYAYTSFQVASTIKDDTQTSQKNCKITTEEFDKTILSCHDPEIIQSLALRMKLLLDPIHYVSTSQDAFELQDRKQKRTRQKSQGIKKAVRHYLNKKNIRIKKFTNNASIENHDKTTFKKSTVRVEQLNLANVSSTHKAGDQKDSMLSSRNQNKMSPILLEGGLTIFNSHYSSGKTTLVTSIARHVLKCPNIHILNPGFLFAKYGVNYVDAALESILHDLVLGAAVNTESLPPNNAENESESLNVQGIFTAERIGSNNPTNSFIQGKNSVCIILDGLDGFVGFRDTSEKGGRGADKGDPSIIALNSIGKRFEGII